MFSLRITLCIGLALASCVASAQSDSESTAQDETELPKPAPCIPDGKMHQVHIVLLDRAYSGKRVSTCEKRLEDGTVFKATKTSWEWRDSHGRWRIEEPDFFPEQEKRHHVSVIDTVIHTEWSWTEGEGADHTAIMFRYKASQDFIEPEINRNLLPGGNLEPPLIAHFAQPEGPGYHQEILKPKMINGVWSEGERLISIVQPGMMNNKSNRPETVVDEFWESVDLLEEVRHRTDDPELGKMDIELIDIDQAEPDPVLFRPPPDYRILDATRPDVPPRPDPLIVIQAPEKE